jgi:hypothetical protein
MSHVGRYIRWRAMPAPMSLLRTIEVLVVEQPTRLYRVTRERDVGGSLDAFQSNYEQGKRPRGPENRAAVVHMALSMFDSVDVATHLAGRVPQLSGYIATLDLQPDLGICIAQDRRPRALVSLGWAPSARKLRNRCCRSHDLTSTLGLAGMTYSIFDSTGNLIDAFTDRAAALDCLAGIAQAEPEYAADVFLIAQDDDGNTVGETVYASSVSVPA